jgi:hypothetical protein
MVCPTFVLLDYFYSACQKFLPTGNFQIPKFPKSPFAKGGLYGACVVTGKTLTFPIKRTAPPFDWRADLNSLAES